MQPENKGIDFEIGPDVNNGSASDSEIPVTRSDEGLSNPELKQHHEAKVRSSSAPTQALPILPDPLPSHLSHQSSVNQEDASSVSSISQGNPANDIFEQRWINEIKDISARTKDDPRLQKEELSKLKAAFIKHKYNKVIRLAGDSDT